MQAFTTSRRRRLADRACAKCGRSFRPAENTIRHCSVACARLNRPKGYHHQKVVRRSFTRQEIEDRSIPVPEAGCHLWLGNPTNRGYGQIKKLGRSFAAHRVAWLVFRGPIPDGLCVMHKCDTPTCVNPDHLRLGTQAENLADRDAKGRTRTGRSLTGCAGLPARRPTYNQKRRLARRKDS